MAQRIIFSVSILLLCSYVLKAQVAKDSPLFIELKKQDSVFFERGFNQCDMDYLEETISSDLKFYHDQSGFQDRRLFFDNTRKYICGNSEEKPIRKLKEGSLNVFPLYNNGKLYGAIQHGIHHFYIRKKGKEDLWTGTAKFTSVWLKENDYWKLSDVLSYDHHDPKPEND
ncbi:MAG: nuclear transport factor 2 family protein [Cyclobacteriaceae bacterium]|nr:nuclear transport factor 2 family protein [Cyclobacteriaceae bacterium]